MAFDLKTNNLSGLAIITTPDSSWRATPENFISLYDYAQQYQPELIPELMYANGKGSSKYISMILQHSFRFLMILFLRNTLHLQ